MAKRFPPNPEILDRLDKIVLDGLEMRNWSIDKVVETLRQELSIRQGSTEHPIEITLRIPPRVKPHRITHYVSQEALYEVLSDCAAQAGLDVRVSGEGVMPLEVVVTGKEAKSIWELFWDRLRLKRPGFFWIIFALSIPPLGYCFLDVASGVAHIFSARTIATGIKECFSPPHFETFLGIFATTLAFVLGLVVTLIVDDESSGSAQEISAKLSDAKGKLGKTDHGLRKTHERLESMARLRPITTYREVLRLIKVILRDCIHEYPDVRGDNILRKPNKFRNLYVLNPTEWFGTTLSYNVDAVLECSPKERAAALARYVNFGALLHEMNEARVEISNMREDFDELSTNENLDVNYATLNPRASGNGSLSSFEREFLKPLFDQRTNDQMLVDSAPEDLSQKITSQPWLDENVQHVYLVSAERADEWREEEQNGDTAALFKKYLLRNQRSRVRAAETKRGSNNCNRFFPRFLDEVPFQIFMSFRQATMSSVPEGNCLLLFSNKYNLRSTNSSPTTGFFTSDPKLLIAFKQIYEAVVGFS